MKARQPWQIKLTDDDFKPIWPTLLLDSIEWEGPVQQSWPPPAHQQIFFGGEPRDEGRGLRPRDSVALRRRAPFAGPRRPAKSIGSSSCSSSSQKLGDNFEASVKTGLLAVLCSKNFLYLVEGSADRPVAAADRLGTGLAAVVLPLEHDAGSSSCWTWRGREAARAGDAARRSPPDAGRPEGGGVRRLVPAPVAATAAGRHVRAGQEALSRLRRVPRKEHDRRDDLASSARCWSSNLQPARVPRFRLDDAQRAPGRALRHRRASTARRCSASR